MTEPVTTNIALIVPATGDLSNTWGSAAINPDMQAIDGFIGGVATISLSNANVTLTAPSGSITPSGGPTQSQNRALKFTGALTASVAVFMPLPGEYTIQNLTTGNFTVVFGTGAAGSTAVSTPQGSIMKIWCDGTNVYLIDLGQVAKMEFWSGISSIPSWVSACSIPPYLLCDGTVYNISAYPYLGAQLGGQFGGNGLTTFAVPDLRGRVPLAYDGTGTRITTAGSSVNGQTIGAAGGLQTSALTSTSQMPPYTPAGSVASTGTATSIQGNTFPPGSGANVATIAGGNLDTAVFATVATTGILTGTTVGSSAPFATLSPAQVAGIWVVKT